MGRLKPVWEPVCFPDIRRTLWAPPVPAVTTTMFVYPSDVSLESEMTGYPYRSGCNFIYLPVTPVPPVLLND